MPGPPTDAPHPWGHDDTPYDALGGEGHVRALVETFYDIIESEAPRLRDMLPANTDGSRQKLFEFMSGWLGGPPLYTEKRGHPMLRMRHMPFPIGTKEANEWMRCMRLAIDRVGVIDPLKQYLNDQLEPLAQHMVNR